MCMCVCVMQKNENAKFPHWICVNVSTGFIIFSFFLFSKSIIFGESLWKLALSNSNDM